MMNQTRRFLAALIVVALLGAATIPASATPDPQRPAQTGGPRAITGSYQTTNPIYPLLGAETGIMLYDLTGEVLYDFDFRVPPEAQVLGTLNGDIVSGDYTLTLPETPLGTAHDFDGDAATPPAVQVFATATYINFLGDIYINRGESPLDLSARLDPATFRVIGGHVLVWSANEGEQFPAGFGSDNTLFTADDALLTLPAGWSVVSLDTNPFSLIRDETVNVPIIESLGELNDYSTLSYVDAWESLFNRTKETYPFTAEKNLDWDAIYVTITPLIQAARSDLEFHMGIIQLGALVPDTHIGFISMPVLQQYLMGGVGISELGVTDDGQVIVVKVSGGSTADRAELQPGDTLISVDGVPALQAVDETPLLFTSASTLHGRRFFQAAALLQGPIGSAVDVVWQTPNGTTHNARLTRVLDAGALLAALGADALSEDVVSYRMLDSGVGYIRITGFAAQVSQADTLFAKALQELMDGGAQGIILDLRGNSGGLLQLAMAMAGHFFPDYRELMDFYYADGAGGFAYRGFIEVLASQPYYDGPVAVLVNEMTGSAGDLFVYAMQTDNRALIVGHTPSGGFTGEVGDGQYMLPGDLSLQIPTGRPVDPVTGVVLLEGAGVVPDLLVPRTWNSLMSPEDEVLMAAEAAILGQ